MDARLVLTAVVPTVLTAASALTVWLCRAGGSSRDAAKQQGTLVKARNASLASDSADELSLVCWNVLADCYAAKLDYASAEQLDWSAHRWPLIRKQLLQWQADLVLLQEIDVTLLPEWLMFAESAGYAAVNQETKGKQVVCLTLFKPTKLQLWWSDTGRSRTLPAAFLLTDSSSTLQVLYTSNCHLEGSPYKPQERLNQLRSTLASLTKHQAAAGLSPADCHVVVAGDFNSGRSEGPFKLLTEGWLPAGYREAHLPHKVVVPEASSSSSKRKNSSGGSSSGGSLHVGAAASSGDASDAGDVTQPYLLSDVYARQPLPFTRKVPSLASHLDWIFATASLAVTGVLWPLDDTLQADRRLPHSRQGLPNAHHPSDHLPLGVQLRVLPSGALQE